MQIVTLEGRPFMSTEDQDAAIGRLVREKKDAERKRAALEEEARRIATNLMILAQHVEKRLSGIQIQGGSLEPEFLGREVWVKPSELEEVKRIIPLANEYRETIKAGQRAARQLKNAGIEI